MEASKEVTANRLICWGVYSKNCSRSKCGFREHRDTESLCLCGFLFLIFVPPALAFEKRIFIHPCDAIKLRSAAIHRGAENAAFIRRSGNCAVFFRVPLVRTNRVHPALPMFAIPIFYGH